MDKATIKNLRSHYHSLRGLLKILEDLPGNHIFVNAPTFRQFMIPILGARADFEKLMAPFRPDDYDRGSGLFDVNGLKAYLATSLGRFQVELDELESAPVTESREFLFINDSALRKLVERDYEELQRAYVTKCYKSTIVLAGGCIEAILLDLLMKNPAASRGSPKAPPNADLTRWDFADLIRVAVDLKLVGEGLEKLSHSVREYRNLIHPGNELRNKLTFDAEEARIAIEVLNMVHRELS